MRPDLMDEICEDYIRVEEICANMVTVRPDSQCDRCNFHAIIKIEPYHEEKAERIIRRIKYVVDVVLRPVICMVEKDGLYVEVELTDNVLREACVVRFATAISNALNLVKNDEEYLELKIFGGGSCEDKDEPQYEDFGTSVSALKVGGLAGFLQEKMVKGNIVGCVKIG